MYKRRAHVGKLISNLRINEELFTVAQKGKATRMLLSSLRWKIDFSHFLSHRIAEKTGGNSHRHIRLESLRGKHYLITRDKIIKEIFSCPKVACKQIVSSLIQTRESL